MIATPGSIFESDRNCMRNIAKISRKSIVIICLSSVAMLTLWCTSDGFVQWDRGNVVWTSDILAVSDGHGIKHEYQLPSLDKQFRSVSPCITSNNATLIYWSNIDMAIRIVDLHGNSEWVHLSKFLKYDEQIYDLRLSRGNIYANIFDGYGSRCGVIQTSLSTRKSRRIDWDAVRAKPESDSIALIRNSNIYLMKDGKLSKVITDNVKRFDSWDYDPVNNILAYAINNRITLKNLSDDSVIRRTFVLSDGVNLCPSQKLAFVVKYGGPPFFYGNSIVAINYAGKYMGRPVRYAGPRICDSYISVASNDQIKLLELATK